LMYGEMTIATPAVVLERLLYRTVKFGGKKDLKK
jgi:hypothetical protein